MQSPMPEGALSTPSPARFRLRSSSVLLGVTALLAAGLTGCSESADYGRTCVDRDTRIRVDDGQCDDGRPGTDWYYVRCKVRVPAIGSVVSGGTFTRPVSGDIAREGFGTNGGTVSC